MLESFEWMEMNVFSFLYLRCLTHKEIEKEEIREKEIGMKRKWRKDELNKICVDWMDKNEKEMGKFLSACLNEWERVSRKK